MPLPQQELLDFFSRFWGTEECAVRLATKEKGGIWSDKVYMWPTHAEHITNYIFTGIEKNKEIFFSPDTYTPEAYERNTINKKLGYRSRAVFLDFDGNAPEDPTWYTQHDLPLPSVQVQSSTAGRRHAYWLLEGFVNPVLIENIRRTLVYESKADSSGWDYGQMMRVPYTVNYKYGKGDDGNYDVFIDEDSDRVYPAARFRTNKEFRPLTLTLVDRENLPPLAKVLMENEFPVDFFETFTHTPDEGRRSDALMRVAYDAAEMGCSHEEIYVLVQDCDRRWLKYFKRSDRHTRYIDIVERAKGKYPQKVEIHFVDESPVLKRSYNFDELMSLDIKISWCYNELLPLGGYGILAGPPSIGKTQLMLRFGISAALGKNWLQWEYAQAKPVRVVMYSLEMNHLGLQHFLSKMTDITPDERALLKQNLHVFPLGEMTDFADKKTRATIYADLKSIQPQLVLIDSLSLSTSGSLNDDVLSRNLAEEFKRIRRLFSCSIVAVHHTKKSQIGAKDEGNLDGLYGSRFVTTDADFVLTFLPMHNGDTTENEIQLLGIRCYQSKLRYSKNQYQAFTIHRTDELNFELGEDDSDSMQRLGESGFGTESGESFGF